MDPSREQVKKAISADPSIKLVFLCSPGNPTGTLISLKSIREILEFEVFKGIVIVDEAYIDFADEKASAVSLIKEYANLCVTQTLSKSFGLAAIRCVLHAWCGVVGASGVERSCCHKARLL